MDILNIKKKYRLVGGSKKGSKNGSKNKSKSYKQSAGDYMGYNPEIQKSKDEDKKCAPGAKFNEGSCFSLEDIIDMCNAFNMYVDMRLINKPKIILSNSKRELLKQLNNRLEDECDDQICWTRQEFIRLTKNKHKIKENTFRPDGPNGKFTWLSTSNITQVLEQYHNVYPDFKYLGTVPMDFDKLPQLGIKNLDFDELHNNGIHKIGIVFNTDNHDESGTHWIALFANIKEFKIYYFDSYGKPPENRVRTFVKRIAQWCCQKYKGIDIEPNGTFMNSDHRIKNNIEQLNGVDIRYNMNRHQYKNSECGVYCMNFILRMLKGETFDQYNENKILDDTVNKCRDYYFTYDDNNNN